MDHKEIRIDTLRDILLKVYGVYTTICSLDSFIPLETNAPRSNALHALLYLDKEIRKADTDRPFDPEKQYFYANALGMIWLFSVDETYAYVLGPAFTDNYSVLDILDKLQSKNLTGSLKVEMVEFIRQIPILSSHRMQQYGMMLYCCLTGKAFPYYQLEMLNDPNRAEPDSSATNYALANYALEQKLWKAVREGNLDYYKELESALTNVVLGKVSGGQYLRQDKNLSIIQVALTCRAAVDGGLSPEIAYSLSDRYIQRIEACRNVSEVAEISATVMDDYINRVHQTKLLAGISPQIRECCSYISMHPEENSDIQKMAQKYGYTPYYFSKKFKQEVGMSLRDYTVKEKIERAKCLLTQSTMSISDISEHLGFNSQSYFGSVFRKLTGMTPSEYQLGCSVSKDDRS